MTEENKGLPTVPDMLRQTGANTAEFMNQIAAHIQGLEEEVVRLQTRIQELEKAQNVSNTNE